jgi:hypothetical protein
MNAQILLIEGTCATGKSTLMKGLLRKYAWEQDKPRTLLHLTQAHTYFPLVSEDLKHVPGKKEHRELLRKILAMLDWNTQGLMPRKWFMLHGLIDTLHLTHTFRPGILSWTEMSYVDQRLAEIGTRMIFLRANRETLWERLIAERGKDSSFFDHQRKFGHTPEIIHEYYVREQEQMELLVRRSALNTLFLKAEDSVSDNTARAYAHWLG